MFHRASTPRALCAILLIALPTLACDFSFNAAAAPTATARPVIASQPTTAPAPLPSLPSATTAPKPTAASGTTTAGNTGLITSVALAQQVTPLSYTPIGASDTFPPKATLHVVAAVSKASASTSVKVVITALDVGSAAPPNTQVGEYTLSVVGTQNLEFAFEPVAKGFPVGTYTADILVNDKLDRTLNYSVKEGIAVVPPPAIKAVGSCPPQQEAPKPSDNIKTVSLAESVKSSTLDPVNPTQLFKPSSQVYAVVALDSAPANTAVKAVWYALDTGGAEACNTRIAEYTITSSGSKNLDFTYQPPSKFPLGNYGVEIYVNDSLSNSLGFSVK
jgi:hypothetical protein